MLKNGCYHVCGFEQRYWRVSNSYYNNTFGGIVLGSRNPAFVEVKIPIRISEYQKILHAGWQLVLVKIC